MLFIFTSYHSLLTPHHAVSASFANTNHTQCQAEYQKKDAGFSSRSVNWCKPVSQLTEILNSVLTG